VSAVRSPSEKVARKACRYLAEGRLVVDRRDDRYVVARCRSDGGDVYALGHDGRRWWCSCPAGRFSPSVCAHLTALGLVVWLPGGGDAA
jgi:hypothetical protein